MSTVTIPIGDIKIAADLLKVLSHPARLHLAMHLMGGEASVSALESALAIRQPGLSQHLGELRDAGLVSTRREHKAVFYTLTDDRARDLLSALSGAFGGPQWPRQQRQAGVQARLEGVAMFAIAGGRS